MIRTAYEPFGHLPIRLKEMEDADLDQLVEEVLFVSRALFGVTIRSITSVSGEITLLQYRTLVVLASEFGRDAITEGKVGREVKDQAINIPDVMSEPRHYGMHRHFTAAGSVLMFGGGIRKGFVYGRTADERPCTTIEHPVPVEDLHATMYHALGIPPYTAYIAEKRPVYVTRDGKGRVIRELFA